MRAGRKLELRDGPALVTSIWGSETGDLAKATQGAAQGQGWGCHFSHLGSPSPAAVTRGSWW